MIYLSSQTIHYYLDELIYVYVKKMKILNLSEKQIKE